MAGETGRVIGDRRGRVLADLMGCDYGGTGNGLIRGVIRIPGQAVHLDKSGSIGLISVIGTRCHPALIARPPEMTEVTGQVGRHLQVDSIIFNTDLTDVRVMAVDTLTVRRRTGRFAGCGGKITVMTGHSSGSEMAIGTSSACTLGQVVCQPGDQRKTPAGIDMTQSTLITMNFGNRIIGWHRMTGYAASRILDLGIAGTMRVTVGGRSQFRGMASGAGVAGTGGDGAVVGGLRRSAVAVVGIAVAGGADAEMLALVIAPAVENSGAAVSVVSMAVPARLAVGLSHINTGVMSQIMDHVSGRIGTVYMAVEVSTGMACTAITRCNGSRPAVRSRGGDQHASGGVMTGTAGVMLLPGSSGGIAGIKHRADIGHPAGSGMAGRGASGEVSHSGAVIDAGSSGVQRIPTGGMALFAGTAGIIVRRR